MINKKMELQWKEYFRDPLVYRNAEVRVCLFLLCSVVMVDSNMLPQSLVDGREL